MDRIGWVSLIKPVSVCKRVRPDKICGRLSTKDGNGKSEGARDERSIEAEPLRNEIETERDSAQLPRLRCTFVRVYSMHTPRIASLQHTAYLKQ